MFTDWQTPLALFVVAVTLALLIRGAWKKRQKPGCGGNCGCPSQEFKGRIKK
jgi:hypothetical protein